MLLNLGLLLKLLFMLPKALRTIRAIMALLPEFKKRDFQGDLQLITEILKLILGLVPVSKNEASLALNELHEALNKKEDLNLVKEKINERKKRCEGPFCPSDLK